MSSLFSSAASARWPKGLSRLAVALLCGAAAHSASAQAVVSAERLVRKNTEVHSTTDLGTWSSTIEGASQTSTVISAHADADSSIYTGWGNDSFESSLHVVIDLTESRVVKLSGTVKSYETTYGGPPYSKGHCTVKLSQAGADIFLVQSPQAPPFEVTVPYDFTAILGPGQYELDVDSIAWSHHSVMILTTGFSDFDLAFDLLPICDTATGSCFATHGTPGCSNHGCCSFVCESDPFCCETMWDGVCVSEAETACTPAYVTGPIIDPWNGHRHRLLDATYWANSLPGVGGTEHGFVTIDSAHENAWLRDALLNNIAGWTPVPAFIGLSDINQEGTFVWSSGKPFTYSNWYTGEPNDQDGEDVVEMSHLHGRWNDISSGVTRAAITDSWRSTCGGPFAGNCYEEGSTPGCADEACCNAVCDIDTFCCDAMWDDVCASEASSFCHQVILAGPFSNPSNGHRYFVLSPTSWSYAERAAREMGGRLASLETSAEAAWLQWAVHFGLGYDNYAIGLDDQAIGGTFRWTSGAPVGYTAWRSGQPSLTNAPGRASVGSDGLWTEVPIASISTAVIEAQCVGDLTQDGFVNGADLAALLGAWGTHDPNYDLTLDGVIDGADLSVLLGGWGSCLGGPACVVHASPGSQQPGCDSCVCGLDPACCDMNWDAMCVYLAKYQCPFACQCP